MFLLISSFLAGVLTSLAPCILPLLPVIIGSSVLSEGDEKANRRKPFIIVTSLIVSVIAFTLLLKVSSIATGINPDVLLYLSGGLVVIIGVAMLFPMLWVRMSAAVGFEHSSNKFLGKAYQQKGTTGAVLTGAALGPVFSSCSPVYALILATILPVNLAQGLVYIVVYALGLGVALIAIALLGKRLTSKIGWAVNPNGVFRKVLAVILILVGLLVATGLDARFQVWAAEHIPGVSSIEERLLPKNVNVSDSNIPVSALSNGEKRFNVNPYRAPEFAGIVDWINTQPLTMENLKGKVVLIDFWTYSCINCQRTQPYLNTWYDKYEKDGFVIIGVHAPEFSFEKVSANVRNAVKDEKIKYPVALDNDFKTWNSYKNQFWPAKYLINKDGQVRYTHFGEGKYEETESAIQTLLKEKGSKVSASITKESAVAQNSAETPETYLSYSRGERFQNMDQFKADTDVTYSLANSLASNQWGLAGMWQVGEQSSLSKADKSVLKYNFNAKHVYLVMDGPVGSRVDVQLNGQKLFAGKDVDANGQVLLDGPRLYELVSAVSFVRNGQLKLTFPNGVRINAFTFGS
ncbi:cytochrome c biogenesis protein DipZ [Aeromicrobium sp.]|nr:cytochrome c biogenesis protein DipZ [Candidatus Saccharibacteria bacterium]